MIYLNHSDTTLPSGRSKFYEQIREIRIFPNPTTKKIVIKNAASFKLSIFDLSGKRVWNNNNLKIYREEKEIVLPASLRQGIYLLRFHRKHKSITKKILIK